LGGVWVFGGGPRDKAGGVASADRGDGGGGASMLGELVGRFGFWRRGRRGVGAEGEPGIGGEGGAAGGGRHPQKTARHGKHAKTWVQTGGSGPVVPLAGSRGTGRARFSGSWCQSGPGAGSRALPWDDLVDQPFLRARM